MTLFREQAIAAQQTQWLGDIVLIRPLTLTFLTIFAVALALTICAFLIWGNYTKHSTVSGQLIPDTGLLEIYSPQPGIIIEKHVVEDQQVKKGDVLFVLSSDRESSTLGAMQGMISKQIRQRQTSLREDIQRTRVVQREEQSGLEIKIISLQDDLAKLEDLIADQQNRVKLAEDTVARYQGLMKQDYISKEQLQQKQENLLDQMARLQSLKRDRIGVERDLAAQQTGLAELPLKHQNQISQIARELASSEQELVESEGKRRLVITAPLSGTATTVMADRGQLVDDREQLVSILPKGTILHAELYAPSRTVGFVKPGDQVQIRYQAYPYQKFGNHAGTVESVAQTALPNNALGGIGNPIGNNSSEPLYRITVKLARQTVTAYGQPQILKAGMLLDADVLLEKRRLYEWVLEPLYSLSGKL